MQEAKSAQIERRQRGRKEEELGGGGRAPSALGATVRAWRTYRSLSVTELAVLAGFGASGRSYISKIEHGYITNLGLRRLNAIAQALGIRDADLLAHRQPGQGATAPTDHVDMVRAPVVPGDAEPLEQDAKEWIELERAKQHLAELDLQHGFWVEAKEMDPDAAQLYQAATKYSRQAVEDQDRAKMDATMEQLVGMVTVASKAEVTTLIAAVETLVSAVRKVSEKELSAVAAGDPKRGEQLRKQLVLLGAHIKRDLARIAHLTKNQIVRLVVELMHFVADILVIADHVQELVVLYTSFAPVLSPFTLADLSANDTAEKTSDDELSETASDYNAHGGLSPEKQASPGFAKRSRAKLAGRIIVQLRMLRPRLTMNGRRDYVHMTKAEFAARYSAEEARLTGEHHQRGESFINKIERGELFLTLEHLHIIAEALKLEPWERALLEEVSGYEGLLRYLADKSGIVVPSVAQWVQEVEQGKITLNELKHTIEDWVDNVLNDLKKPALQPQAEAMRAGGQQTNGVTTDQPDRRLQSEAPMSDEHSYDTPLSSWSEENAELQATRAGEAVKASDQLSGETGSTDISDLRASTETQMDLERGLNSPDHVDERIREVQDQILAYDERLQHYKDAILYLGSQIEKADEVATAVSSVEEQANVAESDVPKKLESDLEKSANKELRESKKRHQELQSHLNETAEEIDNLAHELLDLQSFRDLHKRKLPKATGAPTLPIPSGSHTLQLYNTQSEITESASRLLADGISLNERCLFAGTPVSVQEVKQALLNSGVDATAAIDAGRLVLTSNRDELLFNKRFDPYHLLSTHQTFVAQALREGWKAVRISIDMTWLTKDLATPEQILKYEAASGAVFTFQTPPIIALMHYDYTMLPGALVVELLKLHPIAVVGNMIKYNPYYLNSEQYFLKILRVAGGKSHIGAVSNQPARGQWEAIAMQLRSETRTTRPDPHNLPRRLINEGL